MKKAKGQLWIVAGPSGGGKTTLVNKAVERMEHIVRSVSFTTRQKRLGEEDGVDYVFVDKEKFEQLIQEKQMLEYEKVFDNYYGTSLAFLNQYLDDGQDVILTIDWQGSRHVRQTVKNTRSIFLVPPSIEVLAQRLHSRDPNDKAIIERRMAEAKEQISHYDEFDYLIVNDDLDKALDEMIIILTADRLRRERQAVTHAQLIDELLA